MIEASKLYKLCNSSSRWRKNEQMLNICDDDEAGYQRDKWDMNDPNAEHQSLKWSEPHQNKDSWYHL